MGGRGSGRHRHTGAAPCTDEYLRLDVRLLHREGWLIRSDTFALQWSLGEGANATIFIRVAPEHVELTYYTHSNAQWREHQYAVALDRTPCGFGGRRVWFRCPNPGCGRRVAVLYGGSMFACRQCHGLRYRSQRLSAADRRWW